jgi:diguanylate cyclase (GGDEF)-like protein/PAS domain S-box-containing protein
MTSAMAMATACLFATAITVVWTANRLGGVRGSAVTSAVLQTAMALAAVFTSVFATRHLRHREHLGWLMVAGCAATIAIGGGIVAVNSLIGAQPGTAPVIANIFYGSCLIPGTAAIPLLFPLRRRATTRHTLDMLLMMGSVGFVAWTAVLKPVYDSLQGSTLDRIPTLLSPIACIGMVMGVALGFAGTPPRRRLAQTVGTLGLLAELITASVAAVQIMHHTYQQGTIIDAGWVLGMGLIATAALLDVVVDPSDVPSGVMGAWRIYLPYATVIPAMLTGAAALVFGHGIDAFGLVCIGVVAVTLLVRQALTVVENQGLAVDLERHARIVELASARFTNLVQRSSDVIMIVDPQGVIEYASPALERLLERETPVRGANLGDLVSPEERDEVLTALTAGAEQLGEWAFVGTTGETRHIEVTVTDMREVEGIGGVVINGRDVTARKQVEDVLRHQAHHDPLTGLVNRTVFADRLEQALRLAPRRNSSLTLLFVDLDDFKPVNDRLGHGAGDAVLCEVAHQMESIVRAGDTLARLGGDEFGIILDSCSKDEATVIADRLSAAIATPLVLAGETVRIAASIGLAESRAGEDADDLIHRADAAMYRAKSAGKGGRQVAEQTP